MGLDMQLNPNPTHLNMLYMLYARVNPNLKRAIHVESYTLGLG